MRLHLDYHSGIYLPYLGKKKKNAFPKKSVKFPNSLSIGTRCMNYFIYAKLARMQQWKEQPHPVTWSYRKKNQKEWSNTLIWPTENNHLGAVSPQELHCPTVDHADITELQESEISTTQHTHGCRPRALHGKFKNKW